MGKPDGGRIERGCDENEKDRRQETDGRSCGGGSLHDRSPDIAGGVGIFYNLRVCRRQPGDTFRLSLIHI